MERTWSLYNRIEQLRVDDLRPDQVRTIMLAIPLSQLSNWYACQEGDLQWVALESVSEFYMDTMANRQKAIPLAKAAGDDLGTREFDGVILPVSVSKTNQRRPLFEDMPETEGSTEEFEVNEEREEHRASVRYPRKIEVRAIVGVNAFSSYSENISIAGMKLINAIPDWLPRTFKAELSFNGQTVSVYCKKIGPKQVRLMDADPWEVIRQWLVNG